MALGVLHHHKSGNSGQPNVPGGSGVISASRWKPYTLRGSLNGLAGHSRVGSYGLNATQLLPSIHGK